MRIRDIVPVRSPKVIAGMKAQRQRWADAGVTIEVVPIDRGPFSMEFATEEVLAGPHILEAALAAERDGVDAIVLDCMVDPVLRAARETVSIPVMAPALSGLASGAGAYVRGGSGPQSFSIPASFVTLERNYRSTQPILAAANASPWMLCRKPRGPGSISGSSKRTRRRDSLPHSPTGGCMPAPN
jgi:hypothetical protein